MFLVLLVSRVFFLVLVVVFRVCVSCAFVFFFLVMFVLMCWDSRELSPGVFDFSRVCFIVWCVFFLVMFVSGVCDYC